VKACARCGALPTRLYPAGPMCAEHTPAALSGHPEPGSTASELQPYLWQLPNPHVRNGRAQYERARAELELAYEDRDQLRPVVDLQLPEEVA